MNPERWAQIEKLYHAALEREPGMREAFLDEACADDETLRRQVAALLNHDDPAANSIEVPAFKVAASELATLPGAQTQSPKAPARIGAYQLLSPLGHGGMGEVYLAFDTSLRRKVAVKLLPARFTTDAVRVRRFAQEARAVSALNHPNILTIHEIGEVGSTHYIITEYVEGMTLRQRIASAPQQRMTLSEVIDVTAQIAAALSAAHEAGITHRDIKPENVMVRRDGIVKLLDFGLAKLTEPSSQAIDSQTPTAAAVNTEIGVVMGTPGYMSPEQARGEKVDARTDIFSLGVMLYEMIAGRAPFAASTTSDMLAAILKDEPPLLAEHAPETPPELQHIVSRSLRKDRGERYQTASDLLADLKGLQRGLEFGSEEKKHVGRAKAEGEEKFIVPSPGGITNRRRRAVSGAFAFLLALVGVGLWLYFRAEKSAEVKQLEFKGRFYLGRWTEDEIKTGIEYYNQAIALDPNSVSAYEGLATGWNYLTDMHLSPREAMPKAKAAALNALQRDETSVYAHVHLGLVKMQYEWDWAGAEQEFKRAITLAPEDNSAHQLYGWYLIAAGRFDEAQAEMKRALGTDPLNDFGLWGLGDSFYFARQYEQAIEQYRRSIGVEPKLFWSHLMLGRAYEQQGKFPEAIAELNLALRLNDSPHGLASLGHAYAKSGQRDETQKVIADLQEIGKRRYVSPYDLATIYAGLGEKEQTLAWLEKAYEDRSGWLALWLKVDPKFDLIRSDPRFRDLLRRIGQAN